MYKRENLFKVWGLAVILPVMFALMSLTVYASTPQFKFVSENFGDKEFEVAAGENIEVPFLVQNLDSERSIIIRLKVRQVASDKAVPMPVEWIELQGDEIVDLKPNEEKRVKFEINIPRDADQVLYLGSISVVLADYEGRRGGGAVSFSTAIGNNLLVKVRPSLEKSIFFSFSGDDGLNDGVYLLIIGVLLVVIFVALLKRSLRGKKSKK